MSKELNEFEKLSAERKKLQSDGLLPKWFTTLGYQMFKQKYQYAETFELQVDSIINALKPYCYTKAAYYAKRWKELIMDNHIYLSTPELANTGNPAGGMSVSCAGSVIGNSIHDFYDKQVEAAMLSKNGFGTSSDLSAIVPRGTKIKEGGTANGVLPVFKDFVQLSKDVSQGSTRRGAWAGYLDIEHGDFEELATYVQHNPDGANVGWIIRDSFIDKLESGDEEAIKRFQLSQYVKMVSGRGYYLFIDKVNRARPQMYKDHNLDVKASQLCIEIMLHSDVDHTFTCVIGGMVARTYDEWKNTDAVQCRTVMLDCMVGLFLDQAKNKKGFERAIRATEKGRAIGVGLTGLHTLFQSKSLPFGSFEAHQLNTEISKHIADESLKASQWMAKEWGEPEWCKGYGVRNTHRTAYAPNTSSSLLFGSDSQGRNPWLGNVYNEDGAAGGLFRVNPLFIDLLKKYDKYNDEVINQVLDDAGSCRSLDFLSDHEKDVFKTFYEIDMNDVLRLASGTQKHNCQGQSLNLAFDADEDEGYIAKIHQKAFLDENVHSLYYIRSQAGVSASRGTCSACES